MTDDLLNRARESEAEKPDNENWGDRVTLEVGEAFAGRWRGETIATGGDYGDQRLFLLWDADLQERYMRGHKALASKIDKASPSIGDSVVIYRGEDYVSSNGTGYSYGIATEPNDEPLPDVDDDLGF